MDPWCGARDTCPRHVRPRHSGGTRPLKHKPSNAEPSSDSRVRFASCAGAHRIGQLRPVKAIRFVAAAAFAGPVGCGLQAIEAEAETIEEKIVELQEKKQTVFDCTVGNCNQARASTRFKRVCIAKEMCHCHMAVALCVPGAAEAFLRGYPVPFQRDRPVVKPGIAATAGEGLQLLKAAGGVGVSGMSRGFCV